MARIVVIMGVAGAGKTAVGRPLAESLHWRFFDADDYHSKSNVSKMTSGQPLTDQDRAPWLDSLRALLHETIQNDRRAVLACSALKHEYRKALIPDNAKPGDIRFVFLDVPRDVLLQRLRDRQHHFMKAGMLDSQLAALEEPRDALKVDGTKPVPEIVEIVKRELRLEADPRATREDDNGGADPRASRAG